VDLLRLAPPTPSPDTAVPVTASGGRTAPPTIVLRCGVPRPASALQDPPAFDVDGVSWLFEQGPDGSARVTTTLRQAYVEVTLPRTYAHDAAPLADLASAVKDTVPDGIA
jgi:hypothetical protein